MSIKKLLSFTFLFSATLSVANAQATNDNSGSGNLKYIDPRIGNVGQLLEPTRPTVQLPNQVIRMYPQRANYIDDQISSFPLTIVSHRQGEVFGVKPFTKTVSAAAWRQKQTWDHDLEVTRPWYYSTYLIDEDITVEFTPGKKAGIYRFTFPKEATAKSLLFGQYNDAPGAFNVSGNIMTGYETYHDNIKVYVYGEFSQTGKAGAMRNGLLIDSAAMQGSKIGEYITFPAQGSNMIELRYAISFVSQQQAQANFNEEVKGKTFNSIKDAAEKAWANVFDKIKVEGGTEAQRRSFYTAYYRCNERMVDITEDHKYYSGFDNKIHTTQRPFYTDDWTWDTYLALHPLRAILNPEMEGDMVNSYVTMYQQGGWVPTFPVIYGDHACMNGFHSSIMILDDYRKGIRSFNAEEAYKGMYKNATQATMLPWRNGPKTSLDDFYYQKGYFPALHPGEKETVPEVHPFEKRQAVAVTLGASFDDWALAEFAKDLGKNKDYQAFSVRANNYKNLWDNNMQMFMPKDSKGDWIKIDPKFDGGMGGRDYYDENNGWTYLWQVQHDIKGLQTLMGGKQAFENRLDQLFREPLGRSKYEFQAKFPDATGLVGQYSMGNEPSFHIPYLYNFTDSPWKTQKRIRFLLDVWYKDNIFGIPGDEDGGGMSAFVVFSSMGFYPVTPGLPVYTIGSPVFSKVTLDLPNGKQFKLIANNCSAINKYIQSAKLNGQPLNTPWFTHEQLTLGGVLELEMGPKPNKDWGK
ncbi:GH92 family glycosyl hydrolase [Mucilaginibacter sp. KACC 22063]|uniref:GH92 family glycosyl hydrolase n=1 Tax=Mucilaginibacter sp. KACC 22063 TaxID=3025666 RepID=UPI00236619D4|nr:GH92 family glycosyl hydrolase [Mucilaginibacter sp. KACC 22063]WDF54682.1 GH92 family glycosyl hydrolase [Mucilaginibacter sp. KACC 22063]